MVAGNTIYEEEDPEKIELNLLTDASSTCKYGGTGLGLPIAEKLAAMMSGKISVQEQTLNREFKL